LSTLLFLMGFCLLGGTATASTPPQILSESISGLAETNAVLEADIVPGSTGEEGWEEEDGTWVEPGGAWVQFQLVDDPSEYWPEVTCPEQTTVQCLGPIGVPGEPEPQASIQRRPGDLPTTRLLGSQEARAVALDLSLAGAVLQPGHTYHYRVIAAEAVKSVDTIHWRTPPVYGQDGTFTTPMTPAPLIESTTTTAAVGFAPQPAKQPPRKRQCRAASTSRVHARARVGIRSHVKVHCRRAVAPHR